jgi:hypothetical protein
VKNSECSSSKDCKDSKPCINGFCGCTSDGQCDTGKTCNADGKCISSPVSDTSPKMMRLLTTHGFAADNNRADVDMYTYQGTVTQCKEKCLSENICKGFTRSANMDDNTSGNCYLKKGPLDATSKIFSNIPSGNESPGSVFNSWVKINNNNNFYPGTGATDNTYIKSEAEYIQNYDLKDVSGTLAVCIQQCNNEPRCRGFNRSKQLTDTQTGTCNLKYTNVVNTVNPTGANDIKYNSWVNISVPEQVVSGGNNGCECEKFCGQDWNAEFPATWGGSRCAGTISSEGTVSNQCNIKGSGQSCICMRDDNIGFLQRDSGSCNTGNTERKTITGISIDDPKTNAKYDNYYKKANTSTDRILKLKTIEPKRDDGSSAKDVLCNRWCGSQGFPKYNTGQNEWMRFLGWNNQDNNCLYAVSNHNGSQLNTCNEAVNYGDAVTKQCVCLKRI